MATLQTATPQSARWDPVTVEHADDVLHALTVTPQGWVDPYPLYQQLREMAPLYRSALDNVWYASAFETCRTVLNHPAIRKNPDFVIPRHGVSPGRVEIASRRRRRSMITVNPPEHTRLRGAAKGAFIPANMEAMRARVAEIVDERLDRLAELGEADLMEELAFPLPVTVIGELIGVPEEDRGWFRPLMNTLVTVDIGQNTQADLDRVSKAGDELETYFNGLIAQRSAEPCDDLLSHLIGCQQAGELDEEEVFGTVSLLFIAGFLTTTNLIGNGVHALFEHPDQMARLWRDPELVPSMVEETLRYDSPVPVVHRLVTDDCEIEGQALHPGDTVVCFLAAANRDPARFENPEAFDVGRPDNLHLAFAWGLHFCLGARLARMEGQLVFAGLRERFAAIEPAGPAPRRPGLVLRGFDQLPVRVTPR